MHGRLSEIDGVDDLRLARVRRSLFVVATLMMIFLVLQAGVRSDGSLHFSLFDDAMISMTYARNLLEHGEMTWIVGMPRVEGISNPLWALWMFVLHLIAPFGSLPALLVALSGVGIMLATASVAGSIVSKTIVEDDEVVPLLAIAGVLVSYPLMLWTLRGMEVGLVALLAVLTLRELIGTFSGKSAVRVAVFVGLGVITRTDFILFVGGIIGGLLLDIAVDREDRHSRIRGVKVLIGSALLSLAFILAIQKMYWGEWLPNTYYLKMDGSTLVTRWERGLSAASQTLPWVVFIALSGLLGARRAASRRERLVMLVSSSTVVLVQTYSIHVGGDAWETYTVNRFMAAALPFACVCAVLWIRTVVASPHRPADLVTVVTPLLLVPLQALGVDWEPRSQAGFYLLVIPLITGMALVGTCVINSRVDPIEVTVRQRTVLGICAVLVVVVGSASVDGAVRHIANRDPLHSDTNQEVTQQFVAVEAVTTADASIAVVWAGVTGYNTDRKLIDLLGKNDRRIARMNIRGRVHPGHDKWDYDYSIGTLRPDVIFQLWREDMEPGLHDRLDSWSYEQMCSKNVHFPQEGVWVNLKSSHVDFGALHSCSGTSLD